MFYYCYWLAKMGRQKMELAKDGVGKNGLAKMGWQKWVGKNGSAKDVVGKKGLAKNSEPFSK